jgi:hypothetical protein
MLRAILRFLSIVDAQPRSTQKYTIPEATYQMLSVGLQQKARSLSGVETPTQNNINRKYDLLAQSRIEPQCYTPQNKKMPQSTLCGIPNSRNI